MADPKKIVMKLHVTWDHASAQQLERELVDSDRNNKHLLTCADEVLAQCEACQAFGKAPHILVAGASTVAMFNEKLQEELPFLGDIIALHVMDVFSTYSLLIPARTKNPQEVWDASCSSRIGVFGRPLGIQMD